jgi:hypothetical protein
MPVSQPTEPEEPEKKTLKERLKGKAAPIFVAVAGAFALYVGAVATGALDHLFPAAGDVVPRLLGAEPLKVVSVERVKERGGDYLVIPGRPTEADSAFVKTMDVQRTTRDGNRKFDEWSARRGVYDGGSSFWEIVLEARLEKTVSITRIKPLIEGGTCAPPLKGGTLIDDAKSAGSEKIPFRLDLDARPLEVTTYDDKKKAFQPYFDEKAIDLAKNQTQAFTVEAVTRKWACSWRLEIAYSYDGETGSMVVSAPLNTPFRTTALRPLDTYEGLYPSALNTCGTPRDLLRMREIDKHYVAEEKAFICDG